MKAMIAIMAVMLMTGCASTTGQNYSQDQVDQIVIGETTKTEVLSTLGEPGLKGTGTLGKNAGIDGYDTYFIYNFSRSSVDAQTFIPFVGMLFAGGNAQTKTLTVYFDSNDIVANVASSESDQDVNAGLLN